MAAPRIRANHRHRGDGRWPSGNSSSRNVVGTATVGIHSQVVSAETAAGSVDVGSRASAH
jgi:hypothetical protein